MPRLRDALTVVATGIVLTVLGAEAAGATTGDCPPPPTSECPAVDSCVGGLNLSGVLNLDGLLGGLLGGGCC